MIGRVWRGWTTRENGKAYEEVFRTNVLPESCCGYRELALHQTSLYTRNEFQTRLSGSQFRAIQKEG